MEREKSEKETYAEARLIAALAVKANSVTPELADALIEKVLVYPGSRIEVQWKIAGFSDGPRHETEEYGYAG
jgi:hypothetical protein